MVPFYNIDNNDNWDEIPVELSGGLCIVAISKTAVETANEKFMSVNANEIIDMLQLKGKRATHFPIGKQFAVLSEDETTQIVCSWETHDGEVVLRVKDFIDCMGTQSDCTRVAACA